MIGLGPCRFCRSRQAERFKLLAGPWRSAAPGYGERATEVFPSCNGCWAYLHSLTADYLTVLTRPLWERSDGR